MPPRVYEPATVINDVYGTMYCYGVHRRRACATCGRGRACVRRVRACARAICARARSRASYPENAFEDGGGGGVGFIIPAKAGRRRHNSIRPPFRLDQPRVDVGGRYAHPEAPCATAPPVIPSTSRSPNRPFHGERVARSGRVGVQLAVPSDPWHPYSKRGSTRVDSWYARIENE